MFATRECWLHQEQVTLEFFVWLPKWLQFANRHSIIFVKLVSFANISPLMKPSFLFMPYSHENLITATPFYKVYLSTWFRTQLLVLILFHQSSATLHLFLKISIGFRLISELNLKYLPLPTRLFMVSLLPTLKIFLKTIIHHATLGLQRRIYLSSLPLTQIVMAVVLFLLLRRFSGTVFLSILGMPDHLTKKKTA